MKTTVFTGNFSNLDKIGDFFLAAAVEAGLDDKSAYEVQLAVDEAVTNIIEHAYGGQDLGDIECFYDEIPYDEDQDQNCVTITPINTPLSNPITRIMDYVQRHPDKNGIIFTDSVPLAIELFIQINNRIAGRHLPADHRRVQRGWVPDRRPGHQSAART